MPTSRPKTSLAFIPLAAGFLLLSPGVQATQLSPLARHIPPGKWGLAYQRSGEFKPLFYKHRESGSSYACIQGDPRDYILDWVSGKGCRVDRETVNRPGFCGGYLV
jgi:hypothetical protein